MNLIEFGVTLIIGVVVAITFMVPLLVFVVAPYMDWLFNQCDKIRKNRSSTGSANNE